MSHWSIFPAEPDNYATWVNYHPSNDPDMTFTADECDRWVALGKTVEAEEGTIQGGSVDRSVRSVHKASVGWSPEADDLFAKLMRAATSANNHWWKFDLTHLAGVEILRYDAEDHYLPHVDLGQGFQTRKLSMVVMLSEPDDYKGGDLLLVGKPEPDIAPRARGTIVVFPSYLLHQVTPVTHGIRNTLTAWVQGPSFR